MNSAQDLLHDHVPSKCDLLAVTIPVSLSDHEGLEPLFTVAEGVQIYHGGKHSFQVNSQTPPCIKESSVVRSGSRSAQVWRERGIGKALGDRKKGNMCDTISADVNKCLFSSKVKIDSSKVQLSEPVSFTGVT